MKQKPPKKTAYAVITIAILSIIFTYLLHTTLHFMMIVIAAAILQIRLASYVLKQ